MEKILLITQAIVSLFLIASILLQQRGSEASAITGGSSATYYKKRGFEKVLYVATIILAVLFLALGIINLLI